MADLAPAIAIFPWGEVIEEFLDPLGLTIDDFAGKMSGGWLFGYVQALQSQGWRPIIVCASDSVARITRLDHTATTAPIWLAPGKRPSGDGRRVPWLQYAGQWWRSPGRHFAEILTRERCFAVIAQEYEYFRLDLLSLLARRASRPLYATFQGGDVTPSGIERRIRLWSLGRCNGLIVASARERTRLVSAYPGLRAPVVSIPNPLDTGEWRGEPRTAARAQLDLPNAAFVVINHGRTDIGRKGLDILVEAWKRFAPSHPDAQAFVLGSGQDHDAFARLLTQQAPPRLTWIDRYITDRGLMRCWLSAADVYVTTSRVEGMPVAPLEAMACGLPVVSSDAHGLPDIFAAGEDHGGIVTFREDHDGIVRALERLIGDPSLRSRLSLAARRRVEESFSIPAVGAALCQFIRSTTILHKNHDEIT